MLRLLFFSIFAALAGCDEVKDALADTLDTCATGCARVQECGATPPVPDYGFGNAESTGFEGLDCAAGCAEEDRAKIGYADCQLECLENADCANMQDCWNAGSETFAAFCSSDAPEVAPPDDQSFENGSVTGNEAVDRAVENPAVKDAMEDSEFPIHFGDSPPDMDDGVFYLEWVIVDQRNSRPVGFGETFPQDICLWENESPTDADWTYCQIYGLSLGLHWVGHDDLFTLVVVDEMYQGYISGRVVQDGDTTRLVEVETLWVLMWGPEMWERQTWEAEWVADIGECKQRVDFACPV